MIDQDHRRVPEKVFMAKIATSEPIKRVTRRIFRISMSLEASKTFKIKYNTTTGSYSKIYKPSQLKMHAKKIIKFFGP